jgi:hypothetical protein
VNVEISLKKFNPQVTPDTPDHLCKAAYAAQGLDFDRAVKEMADGTKVESCRVESIDGSRRLYTTDIWKQDGSRFHHSVERTSLKVRECTYKETPQGKTELVIRRRQRQGAEFYESVTTIEPDGSSVAKIRAFADYGKPPEAEGARWLWKRCPRKLRNALGEGATYGRLRESMTSIDSHGVKKTKTRETERWSSADGRRTLDGVRRGGALPDRWTFSNRRGDEIASQMFLWGSEDTWVKREYSANGFRVTETLEDFGDTARLGKERTGKSLPEASRTTVRSKDEASLKDLKQLTEEYPSLKEFSRSDAFRAFQGNLCQKSLTLVLRDSEQRLTNGQRISEIQLAAVASDGSQLIFLGGRGQNPKVEFIPESLGPIGSLLARWGGDLPLGRFLSGAGFCTLGSGQGNKVAKPQIPLRW